MSKRSSVILERQYIPKGTLIMKQGDPGNTAYLLQSGTVEVFTECSGKEISLATLDMGQIFGEMALIFDGEPRTASVRALEDCNLIVITRHSFEEKLSKSDPTIQAIIRMLTKRVASSNNAMVTRESEVVDLVETSRIIYQNVISGLPEERQDAFRDEVLPKLNAFLEALSGGEKHLL